MHTHQASPPAKITRGLATNLGLGGAAGALAPVLVDLVTGDTLDDRTRRLLIVVAGALAAVVILGRSAQAVAVELARGRAGTLLTGELDHVQTSSRVDVDPAKVAEELAKDIAKLRELPGAGMAPHGLKGKR